MLLGAAWVFLVRPQRRRQTQQAQMLAGLEPGDEVVTAGGIYGTIRELAGDELLVEIAAGTTVRVARRAVAAVIEPEPEDEEPSGLDDAGGAELAAGADLPETAGIPAASEKR